MQHEQRIGKSDLVTPRLAYGCMRIAGTWDPKTITPEMEQLGKDAVIAAFENGYKLFDHADIYCRGECERIFGEVLKEVPEMRDRVIIATKCGIRFPGDPNPDSPHRYDFSYQHIVRSCEESLRRLGVETIDIYQLHRPDVLMDPEEVAQAFDRLKQDGKVRWFGVSNFSPSFLIALQSALPSALIANQVEVHLGRLDCLYDGTLDQCLIEDITPLSWSPLGGGFLGDEGAIKEDHPRHEVLVSLLKVIDEIAKERETSRMVIALAWLLKHPSKIVPIVGSVRPDKIREATKSDDLDLTREEWYRLLVSARGTPLP